MTETMHIEGRNALVVGLARTGVATAHFLAARGAQVTASEMRPSTEVAEAVAQLRKAGVAVECGGHSEQLFARADLIVPSPGVPLELAPLKAARSRGAEIISELELAWRFLRGTTVAVTGSNGKTTTTALLGRIFEKSGRPTQVGGNIGTPLVSLVDTAGDDTVNVVEASSFQLEAVVHFRPRVGALLNVTPDHLDRHASMGDYVAAKARMFGQQGSDDFAIFNADDPVAAGLEPEVRAQRYFFSRKRKLDVGSFLEGDAVVFADGRARQQVLTLSDIRLRGRHNLENVLAAVCAARLMGVRADTIQDSVRAFEGVEHRLEFVAEANGVSYFNDSKATNVDSALKAIESFEGRLVVILGGLDKGGDFTLLREPLARHGSRALLIGKATGKIAGQLEGGVEYESVGTLGDAVARAGEIARSGDTVLLAPGCASFDQFDNYEHRGRVFKEAVRESLSMRQEN